LRRLKRVVEEDKVKYVSGDNATLAITLIHHSTTHALSILSRHQSTNQPSIL
jgi:hypothetical protein